MAKVDMSGRDKGCARERSLIPKPYQPTRDKLHGTQAFLRTSAIAAILCENL